MDYVRRNITLTNQLNDQLGKEKNASATIAEALELYFNHKDTVKHLAKALVDFESLDIDSRLKTLEKQVGEVHQRATGGY